MEREIRETALREYTVKLTDHDLVRIGQEMVETDDEMKRVASEKNVAVASFNSTLKSLEAQLMIKLNMLRTKEEVRSEECYVEYDYDGGEVYYVSVETHETVDWRDMTKEERQMKLFADQVASKNDEDDSREEG